MLTDTVVDPTISELRDLQTPGANAPLGGVIALAATFGVELMLTAFVAWGRIAHRKGRALFTARAWAIFHPERDVQIYVAGIALTISLIILLCAAWIRFKRRFPVRSWSNNFLGVQVALAVAGLILFLSLLSWLVPFDQNEDRYFVGAPTVVLLALVGLSMMSLSAIDYRYQLSWRCRKLLVWIGPVLMAISIRMQLLLAPPALELAMLLALGILWYWLRIARRQDEQGWKDRALQRSAILTAMALSSFVAYMTMWPAEERTPTGSFFADTLACRSRIPVIATILCLVLDVRARAKPTSKSPRRHRRMLLDVLAVLILLATVIIPPSQWKIASLEGMQTDQGHHWNYFALGPALAFAHGRSFVTGIYSQYGVGWPYLFAAIRHVVPLSYANVFGVGMMYGCVYVVALYAFLRCLLRDPTWAALGAVLAVSLQIFSGLSDDSFIWSFPSSTMLRHPVDVWFFLVLLAHHRYRSRFGGFGWFIGAGAICGLAVLFELDTGIDLLLILCFYWLLDHLMAPNWRALRARAAWVDLCLAMATAAAVWIAGMEAASRGSVLHRSFWPAYLEGLHNQAFSGLGLLPIANVRGDGLAVFAGMLIVYLFALGMVGERIWFKRGSEIDLFVGSISAYGLGLLLLFVGRSHEWNLYHTMVPLAVVLVSLLYQINLTALTAESASSLARVLLAATVAFLWSKPAFLYYPSLLKSPFITPAQRDDFLSRAHIIDGESWKMGDYIDHMEKVAHAIRQLPAHDSDVVVLDHWDTLLDLLSDRAPWSRYTSLFHSLLTREMVSQTQQELLNRRPRFIVIRAAPPRKSDFVDVWTSFHRYTARHYSLEKTIGGYEFWRLSKRA